MGHGDKVLNLKPRDSRPLLEVTDVQLKIKDLSILNGVSFTVNPGETVGIIGPNGSGKTTLFNCISGFSYPTSGKISFMGEDVTNSSPFVRSRKGIGRVFQNFGIFREMTVLENVVLALEAHEKPLATIWPWGRKQRELREAAYEYLKDVKLEGKANQKAGSLSGGQMRLLEITRTIAFKAQACLLDEPTAGVSPKMKESVAELVIKLQKLGKTVLIIEHDIQFIQKFCDRIVVLDGGKVVLDDSPERVRNNALLQEIYFGAANG